MKFIKKYNSFCESIYVDASLFQEFDITESLEVSENDVLSSISAEEYDLFTKIGLKKEDYNKEEFKIEDLIKDSHFIRALAKNDLRISGISNTDDFQTFINHTCKFILIYNRKATDLENPLYIIITQWDDSIKKWSQLKTYTINDDMTKFYDKLATKVIEIIDGDIKYLYKTGDSKTYELMSGDETKTFKRYLDIEEIKDIVKNKKLRAKIL